jgi:Mrp family chromosome partitioning ATPase
MIEAARSDYDVVLLDTAALNAVSDALPFAVWSDDVLLLSRWNHTSSADIEAALDMLNQVEADPCGVVVTRAKPSALRQTAFSGYFRRV